MKPMCIPQFVCADSQFIYKLEKKTENHHFYGFSCIYFKLLKIRAIFSHEGKVQNACFMKNVKVQRTVLAFEVKF
jgi:hypothetical protein